MIEWNFWHELILFFCVEPINFRNFTKLSKINKFCKISDRIPWTWKKLKRISNPACAIGSSTNFNDFPNCTHTFRISLPNYVCWVPSNFSIFQIYSKINKIICINQRGVPSLIYVHSFFFVLFGSRNEVVIVVIIFVSPQFIWCWSDDCWKLVERIEILLTHGGILEYLKTKLPRNYERIM